MINFPFDLLALFLPDSNQTLLLRACLLSGEKARGAWDEWQTRVGDAEAFLARDSTGAKRLLPLLHYNLDANKIAVPYAWLKAARLYEELRAATFWKASAQIFTALDAQKILFILGKGAAADALTYPQRGLRHSHDLDLIVPEMSPAIDALGIAALKRSSPFQFQHKSGLPIALHISFLAGPDRDAADGIFRRRADEKMISNCRVRTLAPGDLLVQILGHAADWPGRASGQWVCDAWFVLERGDIDWGEFIECISVLRLALPACAMLNYLSKQFRANIPAVVIDEVDGIAAKSDARARDLALYKIRTGPRGLRRNLWTHARGWRSKLELMKWFATGGRRI